MTKLRIVLADDERPAREYLKALLREIDIAEVIGEADNGADAVDLIRAKKPDVALLDLQMPQVTGLDVVRSLKRSEVPLVAFVTAYDEYAVQAFELNAVDYLLKPVEGVRLRETLNRAADRLEREDWQIRESSNLTTAAEIYEAAERSEPLQRIPVKERDSIRLVPVGEISSIVADGELLQIFTSGGQKYTINFRLKDIEARLDERKFVRVSRGSLVNLDHVDSFAAMPGGTYTISLKTGQELPSSRLQSKILRSRLLKL